MAKLSEIALIARYLAPLSSPRYARNLKDDAALLDGLPSSGLVVTADAVVAGVHFFPDDSPADVAYKALAVNVSDLAAKGARPLAYTMTLGLAEAPDDAFASALASGFKEAQAAYGIELIGGDTVSARGSWWISITAFGIAAERGLVPRTAARPGEALYVSGTLGDSALGLKLRLGHPGLREHLSADQAEYLLQRYLRPIPRVALCDALVDNASAAMDISDGIALDLERFCAASVCSASVHVAALPLSDAAHAALTADPSLKDAILTGGDDYEILAAVPMDRAQAFERQSAMAGVPVTRVGETAASGQGATFLGPDDEPIALISRGYEHF